MTGSTLLAPVTAPANNGAAARNATGAPRGQNDGSPSFAGALAAAAQTREADPSDGTAGADDGAAERQDEDKGSGMASAGGADASAAVRPWPSTVDATDARAGGSPPPEVSDRVDGRHAAGLRGLKGSPGEVLQPLEADPMAPGDIARQIGEEFAARTTAPGTSDGAATAVAGGAAAALSAAIPLPGALEAAKVDTRRATRHTGSRTEAVTAAGGPSADKLVGQAPSSDSKRAAVASDAAVGPGTGASTTTRTLQDLTAADARLGAGDPKSGEAALPTDGRLSGAMPSPGMSPSNTAGFVARMAEAPARFEAQLDAALHSPEFVPSLGAQVSTLVRNGIPEARLHLHPAELGPITVQIEIDGQSAQVNMAVEHAATRQVLEQAIPTLASALRDSGLTLTGGGVFQQPREPQGSQGDAGSTRGRAAAAGDDGETLGAALAAGPRARIQRGALDVYA